MRNDPFKTYFSGKIVKKSNVSNLMLFFNQLERTLSNFPDNGNNIIKLVQEFLEILYLALFDFEKYQNIFSKIKDHLEKETRKIEEKNLRKIKGFIQFSKIKNKKVQEYNELRINIRDLEALFWKMEKDLKILGINIEKVKMIPEILNLASKYVFYYTVEKWNLYDNVYSGDKKIKDLEKSL